MPASMSAMISGVLLVPKSMSRVTSERPVTSVALRLAPWSVPPTKPPQSLTFPFWVLVMALYSATDSVVRFALVSLAHSWGHVISRLFHSVSSLDRPVVIVYVFMLWFIKAGRCPPLSLEFFCDCAVAGDGPSVLSEQVHHLFVGQRFAHYDRLGLFCFRGALLCFCFACSLGVVYADAALTP